MYMWRLILLLTCIAFVGCGDSSTKIVLPSAPLTQEEKMAIAISDAEVCNCGRDD
jgi:hypothetical protein